MAFAGIASRTLLDREQKALKEHKIAVTTMISIVIGYDGKCCAYVDECRPAERGGALARHGVRVGDPNRCLPYAFFIIAAGSTPPFVGGNNEDLKGLLRRNAAAITANMLFGEDLKLV